MDVSTRISSLAPSPTLSLNAKAKALKASGADVLNFGVGEPDFSTPKIVVDAAIASLNAGKTKYSAAGGSPKLREAICAKLKRDNDLTIEPNQVVVGIGAKEILFHTFLSILNEGDEVLLPAPYWVSYKDQIVASGGKATTVPMGEKSPIDPELVRQQITPHTKAICLNYPNNPAGYILEDDVLCELGKIAKEHKLWIVADEIYEYLSFTKPHVSLLKLMPELKDQFILINGMSKGFAMTGFRVGYGVFPDPVAKLVKGLQSHSSTCLPPFIEDAACVALEKGRELLGEEIKNLDGRRKIAVDLIRSIEGCDLIEPQGAFYAFINLKPILAKSEKYGPDNTLAFSEYLLEKHHLALVPGEAFGQPGFLRLSYATDEKTIKEGISRLETALKEVK